MSRGELDAATLKRLSGDLPDLGPNLEQILGLSPDIVSITFPLESHVPIAAVCLTDAVRTLSGVRYALFESLAHGVFYREANPPNEMAAVYFERYYVDDAAIRLHSTAEHIANALIFMLELTDEDLAPYRSNRTSQQAIVGRFLADRRSTLRVSRTVCELAGSSSWQAAIAYRNEWVHEQPPTVNGLGIVHHRWRRWQIRADGSHYLGIGGGDSPRYTTAELIQIARSAFDGILRVLDESANHYDTLLESRSIRRAGETP